MPRNKQEGGLLYMCRCCVKDLALSLYRSALRSNLWRVQGRTLHDQAINACSETALRP